MDHQALAAELLRQHQARGENSQAAECYRNVLDVVRRRAGDYEPAFEQKFITLIDRLDPPSATS